MFILDFPLDFYDVVFLTALLQQQPLVPQNRPCLSQFPAPKVTTHYNIWCDSHTAQQTTQDKGNFNFLLLVDSFLTVIHL